MIKHYFCLAAAAVAACLAFAAPVAAAPGFNPADLLTFTIQDLQAADADASQSVTDATGTHMKDGIAHQCYAGVLAYQSSAGTGNALLPPAPVGVISAFQDARDIVKGTGAVAAQGLLPTPVIQSCGALYLDVRNDELKVAAQGLTLFGLKLF